MNSAPAVNSSLKADPTHCEQAERAPEACWWSNTLSPAPDVWSQHLFLENWGIKNKQQSGGMSSISSWVAMAAAALLWYIDIVETHFPFFFNHQEVWSHIYLVHFLYLYWLPAARSKSACLTWFQQNSTCLCSSHKCPFCTNAKGKHVRVWTLK